MKKTIRVGTVPAGDRRADLFCKIELKGKDGRQTLSISGVIGPRANGDCAGGCGQIDTEFAHRNPEDNDKRRNTPTTPEEMIFAPGWSADLWLDFLDIWHRWHLNDLRPGCVHQRDWNTKKEEARTSISSRVRAATTATDRPKYGTPEVKELLAGDWIVEKKRKKGAAGWVRPVEHPEGLLTKPCPVCGYKCGSAWNFEELPPEVVSFLEALPNTDKTPAWV